MPMETSSQANAVLEEPLRGGQSFSRVLKRGHDLDRVLRAIDPNLHVVD